MAGPEKSSREVVDRSRGVLLVNLGSPDAPETAAVRRYLDEFLMDPYVIDTPWPIRRALVSCVILPFRPRRSADAYRAIWDPDDCADSPLLSHSKTLHVALAAHSDLPISLAMRYGSPDLQAGVNDLIERGVSEILLMPLYPHHAQSTRTTIIEKVRELLALHRPAVSLRIIPPFYDQTRYLDVLAAHTRRHLPENTQLLLCSYHGLPERQVTRADPTGSHCLATPDCCDRASAAHASCYRHHALSTTNGLRARLDLDEDAIESSFQSRLGRLPWLAPYTDVVLAELPKRGITRIAVTAPAFVADNLETLEELGIRGRQQFLDAGGESFALLPCLNDDPDWVRLLAHWIDEPPAESSVDQAGIQLPAS